MTDAPMRYPIRHWHNDFECDRAGPARVAFSGWRRGLV